MDTPNIIFILLDDMGYADLGCYGSSFYETPNIDRLADEGMRFTDGYAACPVCSPTRASFQSGKYPATVGVTNWIPGQEKGKLVGSPYIDHLPLSEVSIAQALREGGYATWHVGKWHIGGEAFWPQHHGYDVNVAGCDMGLPKSGYFSPWKIPMLEDGPEGECLTDRLTAEAIGLIKDRQREKPFFLNLCYYAVHTPIQAKDGLVEKYRQKVRAQGLDRVKTFEEGEAFSCEHKKDKRVTRRLVQSDPTYAGMVETVDQNVGKLLAALEEEGLAENTLVIFTSDNGGLATAEGSPTCNAPLSEGKGWMYEGGTREPMIAWWPGRIRPGATCATPVTTPDFYPTFLDLAGLPPRPEQHCDGVSIRCLLEETGDLEREAIFWHYPHYGNQGGEPGSSVRAGDWKLIEFFETGHVELYNLREDVSEDRNRAEEEPAIRDRLHTMLVDWRASVEAKIPEPNPDYEPWEGRRVR
jgi:arylsulfatase A-like enzyme